MMEFTEYSLPKEMNVEMHILRNCFRFEAISATTTAREYRTDFNGIYSAKPWSLVPKSI